MESVPFSTFAADKEKKLRLNNNFLSGKLLVTAILVETVNNLFIASFGVAGGGYFVLNDRCPGVMREHIKRISRSFELCATLRFSAVND